MQVGIVGLPSAGKSTLFNAITKAGAVVGNYPFTTVDSNVGVAEVRDERLYKIAKVVESKNIVPTHIKFVDIAGLVKGASRGEGLGNQFLSYIREVDAIAHVVRCFSDENVSHVEGKINPVSDIETINIELILADMAVIDKKLDKVARQAKSGDKTLIRQKEILDKVRDVLDKGLPARSMKLSPEDLKLLTSDSSLLTLKPVVYVANVSEIDVNINGSLAKEVIDFAHKEGSEAIVICAKLESEIAELNKDEAQVFVEEMEIKELGLDKLVYASYKLLGLITFFTAGPKESKAWTIKKGTKAPEAAGKIHSDMERGFIKAEVVYYEDLLKDGSFQTAREKGHLRLEGKEYVVKDGDVITFKFAV